MKKIDYSNSEQCRNLSYSDTSGMTKEDAIQILQQYITKYHEAKSDKERMWLPRARLIRAYEIAIDALKMGGL